MISLPGTNRKWTPSQLSDIYGVMVATKNIDLDEQGYLKLAKKAMALYSEENDDDFGTILVIDADETQLYVLTTNAVFFIDITSPVLTTTKYIASDKPVVGFQSDMESFQGDEHVSGTTTVKSYNSATDWTSRITGLSASFPHPLCKHGARNTLLVADGNIVRQYTSAYSRDTANELTIPVEYVITRILYKDSNAYILTRNIKGGTAKLFKWSGSGIGNNGEYAVQADWIYSGCEYGSSIAIITSAGELLKFNGAGLDWLADLPVVATGLPWTSQAAIDSSLGKVAARGMEASGSTIYLVINGELNISATAPASRYLADMPSGLWTYDDASGLAHKAGVNYDMHKLLEVSGLASNRLVFSEAYGAETGDAVLCAAVDGLTGVNAGQTYFAVIEGTLALQLALTAADAKAGRVITLGGTPTANDKFAFDSYGAMGSGQITNAGPVFVLKRLQPNLFYGSQVLFGARSLTNALTDQGVLMSLGLGRNIGYFKTPKISSSSITEAFQKLIAKFPQLNLDSESIIVKYRTNERFGCPSHTDFSSGSVAFASATTFEVDTANKDFQSAIVGDEVEFISGAAAGYLAHITAIDKTNPASFVVSIDETLPVAADDLCDVIVDNWKKREAFTNASKDNTQGFAEQPIANGGTWVQFKIALLGPGGTMMLEQLGLISSPKKKPL